MKILYLAPASVIHTVRWVNAMSERGHEVHLISVNSHKEGINKIDNKVKVYYLPVSGLKGYYLNYFFAKRILNRIKPDIINTHYASGYGTLSRFLNYKPTLLSVWGSDVYDFPYESKLKESILRKNLNNATCIASTSYVMADQTKNFLPKNDDIYVTPFGIDLELFKPMKNIKTNEDIINIGTIKTLKEKYGIKYLIEAVAKLINILDGKDQSHISKKIRLTIVGEGELRSQLEQLSKDLGIWDITIFKGYIENKKIPYELNNLDIYCAPSILDSESFGVAIIEASACELPVIVSNVGGLVEVVEQNVTGYAVPKEDSESLANKLYELVINPELRKKVGSNGRNRVKKLYDWNNNVDLMESIYKSIIKEYNK